MKRFLLFAGDTYYPSGGFGDFRSDFDTEADAISSGKKETTGDWWQVVDQETREYVYEDGTRQKV